MLGLKLDVSSERRLAEEAQKFAMTKEQYASLLLEKALTAGSGPSGDLLDCERDSTVEQSVRVLDRLIEEQDESIPAIPEEALRRESLYEDRL